MGYAINQALEIIVVGATLCLLLTSFFFERRPDQRRYFRWMFAVLALLAVGNFFNFGQFHGGGRYVHDHEQYHFFLGSKYLPELRYDAIYDASLMALLENGTNVERATPRRDPLTFKRSRVPLTRRRIHEIHARFSAPR